jgi:flagellar biosynthesis/type III secretory pathway chaperone
MDTVQRVSDLIHIGRALAELLAEENAALNDRAHQVVGNLVERKTELSRAYESRFQGLLEQAGEEGDLAEGVDPALREELRAVGDELRTLTEENAHLLTVAREVNRRVLDLVAEAVKAAQPGPGTYSPSGRTEGDRSARVVRPLSLDRSL